MTKEIEVVVRFTVPADLKPADEERLIKALTLYATGMRNTEATEVSHMKALKLDVQSNDPSDEELTVTVVEPPLPEGMEKVTFEWSTEKGRCYDCGLPAAYRLVHIAVDGGDFLLCSVDAAYHAAHGDEIEYLFEEEES